MKLAEILREHGEVFPQPKKKPKEKNPLAVALGRRGGQARARSLSRRERQAIARYANEIRWHRKDGAK